MCQVVQTTEEALASRLLHATIQALELYSVYLGKELGLYRAMQGGRRFTPPELARAAGIAPRYAREWLEQQAVAGFIDVDDARRFSISEDHVRVLASPEDMSH